MLVVWRSASGHSAAAFGNRFEARSLADPRFVGILARDGIQLRAAVWDQPAGAPRRGICVLLEGLTEFIEKYGEVADELVARGFVVASVDWRSQGASERMAQGNRKIHVRDFEEYDLDLAALMKDVVQGLAADSSVPLIALAHSMGAHILLRYLHDNRRRFACAVMVAPMLAVDTKPYSLWLTRLVTAVMNIRRPSKQYLFGTAKRDPMTLPFEQNMVTRDRDRHERMKALLRAQPFLRVHGATFGWLGAALRSIRQIWARGFPEAIQTPILIVGAGADRVVITAPEREYAKRLPNARYVEIADSEHEILMERDEIRAQFWRAFDGFVSGVLPS